jgi:type I restriction enzyme, S subunit
VSIQADETLPPDWKVARVGEILTVRNGYAVKSSDYSEEGVPLIRQSDINGDTIDISGAKRVPARLLQECRGYLVREGDLLIGMSGSLGKIGRYVDSEPAVQNQRTGLLVLKPGVSAGFAKLVLKFVERQIVAEGKGIAVQNVSAKEIEACTFPLAPTEERERIVAEIEKQFTRLEAGMASLKRVQVALKRYRASVLKAACEGRLVPTEAELARRESRSYEPASILVARIQEERRKQWHGRSKFKKPVEPHSANGERSELPDGWAWASFDQLTGNFDGRRIPIKSAARDQRPGPYAYYGASGVIDDIDDFLFDGDFLLIGEDGANLLTRSTPIAFRASGKFWVNNHAHVVQARGGIPINYLELFLNGKDLKFYVTGSAQPKLTQASLNKLPVPLPPLAEQHRIVAEAERRLSVIKELESVVAANLKRAVRLRQAILHRVFRGGLVSPS